MPKRADVDFVVRAARDKDREALAAVVMEGRVWHLPGGTPILVAQVFEDASAIYVQRGQFREKRCYVPTQMLEGMVP